MPNFDESATEMRLTGRSAIARSRVGIACIGCYQPEFALPNAWFESIIAKKFVKHTGICSRYISSLDEVGMAQRAVDKLQNLSNCDLADCASVILACPSVIPQSIARRYLSREEAHQEHPQRLAEKLISQLGCSPRVVAGINGFCSGYAQALELMLRRIIPQVQLGINEYVLVITSSRISRITDFACRQSGPLFGDYATASLISRVDSPKYPMRFRLVDATYGRQPVSRAYFDFLRRQNVLVPTQNYGRVNEFSRVVFHLDGMGIADTAPRAMAAAAVEMIRRHRLPPKAIDHIVPHQAGTGIVRLTAMKLEQSGLSIAPLNGLTEQTGNISSGSVPYALSENWDNLDGNIICPVAAVGRPGKAEVSHGCIFLAACGSARQQAA